MISVMGQSVTGQSVIGGLQTVKAPVSMAVGASAVTGYLLHAPAMGPNAAAIGLSVFLVAGGAAAVNNWQEKYSDRLLHRTRHRPVPSNRISRPQAITLSLLFLAAGFSGLALSGAPLTSIIAAAAALVIYNGIYTPLKHKTIWSILPGAVCGMLPPMIGWLAAGGDIFALKIWVVMAMFAVWQPPHFWLILLWNIEDYRKAPLPSMVKQLSVAQLKKIILVWVMSFASITLLLPVYGVLTVPWIYWLCLGCVIAYVIAAVVSLFFRRAPHRYRHLFFLTNMSIGVIMLLIVFDSTISGGSTLF